MGGTGLAPVTPSLSIASGNRPRLNRVSTLREFCENHSRRLAKLAFIALDLFLVLLASP
jgi:hypothetical protein